MLHDVDTVPKLTLDVCTVPFMSQITRWPVELFCQRMSALPSPLKSPVPAMLHDVATNPKLSVEIRMVPFMSQITRGSVERFWHRMFALPSPLRSLLRATGTAL